MSRGGDDRFYFTRNILRHNPWSPGEVRNRNVSPALVGAPRLYGSYLDDEWLSRTRAVRGSNTALRSEAHVPRVGVYVYLSRAVNPGISLETRVHFLL